MQSDRLCEKCDIVVMVQIGPYIFRCPRCAREVFVNPSGSMKFQCKTCGIDVPAGIDQCLACSVKDYFPKERASAIPDPRFHIRRHIAGFTPIDQPIYEYVCSRNPQSNIRTANGAQSQLCSFCISEYLSSEILCDRESCEHHSTVSFYVAIVDVASGSEIGELCESENLHAAEKKVNDLNALDADPDTRFRIGQRRGRKKQQDLGTTYLMPDGRIRRGPNLQNIGKTPEDGSFSRPLSRGIDWGKVDSAYAELPVGPDKPR